MDWLRAHPYLSAIAGSIALLLAGAVMIQGRAPVSPNASVGTWGSGGGSFLNLLGSSAPREAAERTGLYEAVQSGPPFSYTPFTRLNTGGSYESDAELDAIIALLSQGSGGTSLNMQNVDPLLLETYSFIPRGLISTDAPRKTLTSLQQALLDYGNDAGLYIQSFENKNPNMARVLKDQFEDPQNTAKKEVFLRLANGMIEVGSSLETLSVPPQAQSTNARLAQSYKDMGVKLALIPSAKTEAALLDAMLAYNATVDAYITNYISLVTLFSVAEVEFGQNESGSVFMFSGGTGF